jgi:hypothetical protein
MLKLLELGLEQEACLEVYHQEATSKLNIKLNIYRKS